MAEHPEVIVIFGPTASGKTGAAVEVAKAVGGEVINADSRQVYEKMSVITAVPTLEEQRGVPHHLFEFVDPSERMSAAAWASLAEKTIENVLEKGKVPVVVGGTGLYLRSLMEGLSEVPPIPVQVEENFRGTPAEELHRKLEEVDSVLAAKLHPSDTQRITRGLVVHAHTGKPLSEWQAMPGRVPPYKFRKLALSPEREELYARINRRWEMMVERGVLAEIKALKEEGYTLDMPGMQGLGIAEIFDYIDGHMAWQEVGRVVAQGTRHYAKRQVTWLRNSFGAEREFLTAGELVAFARSV